MTLAQIYQRLLILRDPILAPGYGQALSIYQRGNYFLKGLFNQPSRLSQLHDSFHYFREYNNEDYNQVTIEGPNTYMGRLTQPVVKTV